VLLVFELHPISNSEGEQCLELRYLRMHSGPN